RSNSVTKCSNRADSVRHEPSLSFRTTGTGPDRRSCVYASLSSCSGSSALPCREGCRCRALRSCSARLETLATIVHAGFTYTGTAAPALEDISLEIVPGTMTAVLGAVGSGTSTLCRLLGGLLESRGTPTGRIETDGTVAVLGDDPEAQLSGLTSH